MCMATGAARLPALSLSGGMAGQADGFAYVAVSLCFWWEVSLHQVRWVGSFSKSKRSEQGRLKLALWWTSLWNHRALCWHFIQKWTVSKSGSHSRWVNHAWSSLKKNQRILTDFKSFPMLGKGPIILNELSKVKGVRETGAAWTKWQYVSQSNKLRH